MVYGTPSSGVYGTPDNANQIDTPYEGGGWENKVSASSLKELRDQLSNLSTLFSYKENSYGIERASSGVAVRLIDSENTIDSIKQYNAFEPNEVIDFRGYGNYQYNDASNNHEQERLDLPINLNSYPTNIYNSLGAYRDNEFENSYLTFDLQHSNLDLSNGIWLNQYNDYPLAENPEYVIALDNNFWKDVNEKYNEVDTQKNLSESLSFEIYGLPQKSIDLSSIKKADDPSEAINEIVESLKVTVHTDEQWDLPLYSDVYGNLNFWAEIEDNHFHSVSLSLMDHDIPVLSQNYSNNNTRAIESQENNSGTILEFGLRDGYQLNELIRTAQSGFNNTGTDLHLELDSLNLSFDKLLDGSNYHLQLREDSNKLFGAQSFSINPYNDYYSDFSEEGLAQLDVAGDFTSPIDIWSLDNSSPQIKVKMGENGISKYERADITLEFEGTTTDDTYSNMYIHVGILGPLTRNFDINYSYGNENTDIADYNLKSIRLDANEWNIDNSNGWIQALYNVDDNGEITAINNGSALNSYIPNIEEFIPNVNALKSISLTGMNDLSNLEKMQTAVELGMNGASFPWNQESPIVDPPPTDASMALSYNLYQQYDYRLDEPSYGSDSLNQLAVLGDSVNESSRYVLDINAESLENNYSIESTDITIEFDPQLFGTINASDIKIGGELPLANAVHIDNDLGSIRFAAASLSDLGEGSGITGTNALASIALNFDESQIQYLEKNPDGSLKISPLTFDISVNEQETIFSNTYTDASGFKNREILTLDDLGGGVAVDGQEVTLYEAQINLKQQGDGLVLGTERIIGTDAEFTNLIRKGDTISTSTEWLNVGNIEAKDLSYSEIYNQNATIANASFSQENIASGSFIDGEFVKDARESTTFTADININGEAGNVVDLSDGIVNVHAQGTSDVFSNEGLGSSNLITFQGDLNYDGRVSMKDLAYLNAGAARQQYASPVDTGTVVDMNKDGIVDASVANDVDADFSGKIDLNDLAVLDSDWGKTLHTGDEQFQGSNDVSWTQLDSQGNETIWNNDSFKNQNDIEAQSDYVGSLESPASNGVIGVNNTPTHDGDIQGEAFQDPLAA